MNRNTARYGYDAGTNSRALRYYKDTRCYDYRNRTVFLQILLPDPHARNLYNRLAELGVCRPLAPLKYSNSTGSVAVEKDIEPLFAHGSCVGFPWTPFTGFGICHSHGTAHSITRNFNNKENRCKGCRLILRLIRRGILRKIDAGVHLLEECHLTPPPTPTRQDVRGVELSVRICALATSWLKKLGYISTSNGRACYDFEGTQSLSESLDLKEKYGHVITFNGRYCANINVALVKRWYYIIRLLKLDNASSKAKGFITYIENADRVGVNHTSLSAEWVAYNYRTKKYDIRRGFVLRQSDGSWRYEEALEDKRLRRQEIQVDKLSDLVGLV